MNNPKAVGQFILVEEVKEEVVQGGLVLTEKSVDDMRYRRGKVLSAGTEIDFVEAGQEIYYDKSRSFSLIIQGTSTTVIRGADVVVIL